MLIEYHILQNFAPHCLNRDDTNSPKDCVFGGHRRARISSQCLKRAVRQHSPFQQALPGLTSIRTKRVAEEIGKRLKKQGHDAEEATSLGAWVLEQGLKIKSDKQSRTAYLLFIGEVELSDLCDCIRDNWDALVTQSEKKSGKLPDAVSEVVQRIRDEVRSVDLALFGRMIAELPDMNVDASCQVAHAISTNAVEAEMDFYTAVDDLSPEDEPGAGMMGIIEFNSSCFYRYAVLNYGELLDRLKDEELARKGVDAFSRAFVEAIPTGKQNSMAAHNPPDYVRAMVREGVQPLSLANAFLRPVTPTRDASLTERSVSALEDYQGRLQEMYGWPDPKLDLVSSTGETDQGERIPLPQLYQRLSEAL